VLRESRCGSFFLSAEKRQRERDGRRIVHVG
jgi:hypothetical protein